MKVKLWEVRGTAAIKKECFTKAEKELNEFLADIKVLDIKMSTAYDNDGGYTRTLLICYE